MSKEEKIKKMEAFARSVVALAEEIKPVIDFAGDRVPVWALDELEEDYGDELETYEEMAYRAYTEGKYTYDEYVYVCETYEHCTPRAR